MYSVKIPFYLYNHHPAYHSTILDPVALNIACFHYWSVSEWDISFAIYSCFHSAHSIGTKLALLFSNDFSNKQSLLVILKCIGSGHKREDCPMNELSFYSVMCLVASICR